MGLQLLLSLLRSSLARRLPPRDSDTSITHRINAVDPMSDPCMARAGEAADL